MSSVRPLVRGHLGEDDRTLLPLRPELGPDTDRPVRQLLHRHAVRVPADLVSYVREVVEDILWSTCDLGAVLDERGHQSLLRFDVTRLRRPAGGGRRPWRLLR